MIENLLFKESDFMAILKNDIPSMDKVELIDIVDHSTETDVKVSVEYTEACKEIYEILHEKPIREDYENYISISRQLERNQIEIDINFNEKLNDMRGEEIKDAQQWFKEGLTPDIENPYLIYNSVRQNIRNVSSKLDLIESLICNVDELSSIEEFIKYVRKMFKDQIIFDEDIESSMRNLSNGYDARKREIIYHLYCLYVEIPRTLSLGISDYINIGKSLSIDCSPERSREIVSKNLIKSITNPCKPDVEEKIQCELHTKMRKIGSTKPDRIYFSPNTDVSIPEMNQKIYIYKITAHV